MPHAGTVASAQRPAPSQPPHPVTLQPLPGPVCRLYCASPPCLTSRPDGARRAPGRPSVPLPPRVPSTLATSAAGPPHALSPGVSCGSSAVLGPSRAFLVPRVPSGSGSFLVACPVLRVLHLRWLVPPLPPPPPVTRRREQRSRPLPCSRLARSLHACPLKTCGSPGGLLGRWACHASLRLKSVSSPLFSRDSGQVLYTSSAHCTPLACAALCPQGVPQARAAAWGCVPGSEPFVTRIVPLRGGFSHPTYRAGQALSFAGRVRGLLAQTCKPCRAVAVSQGILFGAFSSLVEFLERPGFVRQVSRLRPLSTARQEMMGEVVLCWPGQGPGGPLGRP